MYVLSQLVFILCPGLFLHKALQPLFGGIIWVKNRKFKSDVMSWQHVVKSDVANVGRFVTDRKQWQAVSTFAGQYR